MLKQNKKQGLGNQMLAPPTRHVHETLSTKKEIECREVDIFSSARGKCPHFWVNNVNSNRDSGAQQQPEKTKLRL